MLAQQVSKQYRNRYLEENKSHRTPARRRDLDSVRAEARKLCEDKESFDRYVAKFTRGKSEGQRANRRMKKRAKQLDLSVKSLTPPQVSTLRAKQ